MLGFLLILSNYGDTTPQSSIDVAPHSAFVPSLPKMGEDRGEIFRHQIPPSLLNLIAGR